MQVIVRSNHLLIINHVDLLVDDLVKICSLSC